MKRRRVCYLCMAVMLFFFFPCYVFADKMPVEKRDSIISDKKISPNGQGLYFPLPNPQRRKKKAEIFVEWVDKGGEKQTFSVFLILILHPTFFFSLSLSLFHPRPPQAKIKTFHFLANHFTVFSLTMSFLKKISIKESDEGKRQVVVRTLMKIGGAFKAKFELILRHKAQKALKFRKKSLNWKFFEMYFDGHPFGSLKNKKLSVVKAF